MRVHDHNTTGPAASEAGRTPELQKLDRAGAARAGAPDLSGDRIEFTSSLGQLAQAISTDSATRASRVQSLTADYQAGRYRPDSQATSRGIVAEAVAASHV
jgi:anti-sigma-28 factor FlgM